MRFSITLSTENLPTFIRRCGYAPEGHDERTKELKFSRSITGRHFPRFHLYAKVADNEARLNLHVDQKQPSYLGSPAHSGEYEGPLLQQEAQRILSKT